MMQKMQLEAITSPTFIFASPALLRATKYHPKPFKNPPAMTHLDPT